MQRYIHNQVDFFELFEKLKFEMDEYDSIYTAMIFEIKDEYRLNEFGSFLLKYLRISDTVFTYRKNKLLVILEETTLRGALILNDWIRKKIKNKWFIYDYYCSAIQWNFIASDEKLLKSLEKRLELAHKLESDECIHDLSEEQIIFK